MQLSENEKWLLSFYRSSEISGALFFGRLARVLRSGPVQADMTRHFADESQHARYWTDCIAAFNEDALKIKGAYQDQYLEAGGMPVNMMEILAVTLVFERRVVGQYVAHSRVPGLAAPIQDTLSRIMDDERWHIRWVSDALKDLEPEYGKDTIDSTLERYTLADREIYQKTLSTHAEIVRDLVQFRTK
jgi:hypothetical protein